MGIVLIGMMGCGKTTLGKHLSQRLGWRHLDLDEEVVRLSGRAIAQIFEEDGEEAFRRLESEALSSIRDSGDLVLSVGGGAPTREENWPLMRHVGPVVYLKASEGLLIQRLERSRRERPLLKGRGWRERLGQLLQERERFYARADHVVALDGSSRSEVLRQLCQIAVEDRE
ncbi:MAG: shikimate kinase [Fimbriimonadales bacterium]|nr:MAG: shikimate kinase [Fimbriimonadales bacterium]